MKSKIEMSKRARRTTTSFLALFLTCFAGFIAHSLSIGTTAFPNGRNEDGRYRVLDHGKTHELTRSQFYTSYALGGMMLASVILTTTTLLYFYAKKEIRTEGAA